MYELDLHIVKGEYHTATFALNEIDRGVVCIQPPVHFSKRFLRYVDDAGPISNIEEEVSSTFGTHFAFSVDHEELEACSSPEITAEERKQAKVDAVASSMKELILFADMTASEDALKQYYGIRKEG